MPEAIIDMSDARERSRLLNQALNPLRGRWRFAWKRYRPRRSDRQNRYYWPCFVQPFAAWMRQQGNDVTDEQAHDILKHRFLRVTIAHDAGEFGVHEYTRSTTELDTGEFNEYLDRCAAWLAEFCGIVVPSPDEYREQP